MAIIYFPLAGVSSRNGFFPEASLFMVSLQSWLMTVSMRLVEKKGKKGSHFIPGID
jgi:hypothetical protein